MVACERLLNYLIMTTALGVVLANFALLPDTQVMKSDLKKNGKGLEK